MIPKDMAARQEPTHRVVLSFIKLTLLSQPSLPQVDFYLQTQHLEKSNTVASEIKL